MAKSHPSRTKNTPHILTNHTPFNNVNKITSNIQLRTDKINSKGYAPIILHISIDGKRKKISLNESLPPECFDVKTQRAKTSPNHKELLEKHINAINAIILTAEQRTNDIRLRTNLNNQKIDVDAFDYYFKNAHGAESFIDYTRKEIESNKKYLSDNTYRNEKQMVDKLVRFRSNISFTQINQELIDSFRKYLAQSLKLHNNTVNNVLKKLKKYILIAKSHGHPVADVKLKTKEVPPVREYLTRDEIRKLDELYDMDLPKTLKVTLHFFLISCHTSLRISDKDKINSVNVNLDEKRMSFMPEKTKRLNKVLHLQLTDAAVKYIKIQLINNFKPYSDQKLNQYLKEIMRIANINKKITFHSARHSFAFNYVRAGGNVVVLQNIMGHSNIKTTMVYFHVNVDSQKNEIEKLNEYFNQ